MDKQEIINELNDFPYSRDEYWVITGSAMVLYGIREQTHDIDVFALLSAIFAALTSIGLV